MANETVTISRNALRSIQEALGVAISVTVALEETCENSSDGSVNAFLVSSCVARQGHLVCAAQDSVTGILNAAA
jgi:hypothetical protein